MKVFVCVVVIGVVGQIGYVLLFCIVFGEMLGKDQLVILQLFELLVDKVQVVLCGVMMELEDCVFLLLVGMVGIDDVEVVFKDVDIVLLVGVCLCGLGMECKDLLLENVKIFIVQGVVLNKVVSCNVKVLVVGNLVNINVYIVMKLVLDLNLCNFIVMLCLDYNCVLSQLLFKLGKLVGGIEKLVVWGNYSLIMYLDYCFVIVDGVFVVDVINDQEWNVGIFILIVGKCGVVIIEVCGLFLVVLVVNVVIDYVCDWVLGSNGKWVMMGVLFDGFYGILEGVIFGFVVIIENGEYILVKDLLVDDFSQKYIDKILVELEEECVGVVYLLG